MIKQFKKIALLLVLGSVFSASVTATTVLPDETAAKTKLQFVRSSGKLSVMKARIEVNGKRIAELGKGESGEVVIEPGRTLIKIDSSYSPGQMTFTFVGEKGSEYRFDVFDSVDKMDAEHLFGTPAKASNGEVLESSGLLKATLFSVKLPALIKTEAAVTPPTTPVVATSEKASLKEQLQELKKLYEQELISKEIYLEKQKKILEAL
jgi:hypothetical protein